MEGRAQRINEAQAQATEKIKGAEAQSETILARARAAYTEKTQQARGEVARFLALSQGRKQLDFASEVRLVLEASDAVLRGRPIADVLEKQRRDRDMLERLQGALADFRIYWDVLASALLGRDLVLIDADNIKGQRNLFLFDADLLRAPMLLPSQQGAK
jgi:hypothetical protein